MRSFTKTDHNRNFFRTGCVSCSSLYFKVHVQYFRVHVLYFRVHVQYFKVHVQYFRVHVQYFKVHVQYFKVHIHLTKPLSLTVCWYRMLLYQQYNFKWIALRLIVLECETWHLQYMYSDTVIGFIVLKLTRNFLFACLHEFNLTANCELWESFLRISSNYSINLHFRSITTIFFYQIYACSFYTQY